MQSLRIKNSITVAFLLLFSFYAASPLAGTFTLQCSSSIPFGDTPVVKIYLVHFLLSSLFDVNAAAEEQNDTADDHCLIKKKRAILSAKNLRSLIALSAVRTASSESTRSDLPICAGTSAPFAALFKTQDPIVGLHSGHAPPLA